MHRFKLFVLQLWCCEPRPLTSNVACIGVQATFFKGGYPPISSTIERRAMEPKLLVTSFIASIRNFWNKRCSVTQSADGCRSQRKQWPFWYSLFLVLVIFRFHDLDMGDCRGRYMWEDFGILPLS